MKVDDPKKQLDHYCIMVGLILPFNYAHMGELLLCW